jgi:uncharacterized membrane protein
MSRCLTHPDRLFLLIAIPFGLLFAFLTPPFGGGDESFHYHRTADIAYFHILDKESKVPAGVVAFIYHGMAHYLKADWVAYSRTEYERLAAIPLDAGRAGTLMMNILTVNHPINYLPQAVAFRLAAEAGAKPLALLYIARLAGLAAGIALTWLAIRVMPSHRYLLAGFALLPTIVYFRSFLHTDAVTDGMAFLFIALALRAITETKPISTKESFLLALFALLIASCKGAYAPLALLALAIPRARFASLPKRLGVIAAIIIPAFIGGLGWMYLVKTFFFIGYHYQTWGGDPVPDEQLSFILHQPFAYLGVVVNTLFGTPFFLLSLRGILAEMGFMDIHLPSWTYGMLVFLLAGVAILDVSIRNATYTRPVRMLTLALFLACFGMALTLLYIQWTGVQAPTIKGFQGRYFTPVLPLLFLFVKPVKQASATRAGWAVVALGMFGLSAALWSLITAYYFR